MFFAALVSFVGTLMALVGWAALLREWVEAGRTHLLAWSVTLVCLAGGLGAMAIGLAVGFRPVLFRVVEVGAGMLAGLWLILGLVELMSRHIPPAFGTRLLVGSSSIVGGVIVALDRLGQPVPVDSLPIPEDLYLALPLTLLTIAHLSVLAAATGGVMVAAVRYRRGDEDGWDTFTTSLAVLLAALLIVVGVRPALTGLGAILHSLLLALAAGLVWVAPRLSGILARIGSGVSISEVRRASARSGPRAAPRTSQGSGRRRRTGTVAAPTAPPAEAPEEPDLADHPTPPAVPSLSTMRRHYYGHIVIFTLREGASRSFDSLVEDLVQKVKDNEPRTVLFTCHTVSGAPQQRIFYELYESRVAFDEHERQPHVMRFVVERERYVLATNVIRLELGPYKMPESDRVAGLSKAYQSSW